MSSRHGESRKRTGSPKHPLPPALRRLFEARRRGAWLAVLASLGLGGPANAESPDRWRPNPNVGDRTTTFGHEVLHCFGLMHE